MWFRGGLVAILLAACGKDDSSSLAPSPPSATETARQAMVATQLERRIRDERVLAAMGKVLRHEFVPGKLRAAAYSDRALDIGHNQKISRPYIVAVMTELAQIGPGARVLEIGTGSGYGAAVLGEIADEVYTIEILEALASRATETILRLGYRNVFVRHGDGYRGWKEAAPFDAIIVTAAPPRVPEPLKQQLKVGGRLVLPVGEYHQEMRVITRTADGFSELPIMKVHFERMTGEVRDK